MQALGADSNASRFMLDKELREIQRGASEANLLIEGITAELAPFPFDKPTERTRLALAPLRSTVDMAPIE